MRRRGALRCYTERRMRRRGARMPVTKRGNV
jgi:hypothetical protein